MAPFPFLWVGWQLKCTGVWYMKSGKSSPNKGLISLWLIYITMLIFLSPSGWVWQTPPFLLQPGRCPAALLQCGQPRLLSKCLGEVGARDPPPLPPHSHPPRGHTVWPAAGRQSADRARETQGEASAGGRCQGAVGKNRRGDVHWVLGADTEESEGGVWCGHRCGAAELWQESEAGEEGPQHSW